VIAVTCRNGEHFSVDPKSIERVESDPDTVIHLVDGTKYVVNQTVDELMLSVRDHRATALVAQKRLFGGIAEWADNAAKVARQSTMRVERRQYSRDGDGNQHTSDAVPGTDED
jgi:uncharacterized protein YlzI (FlbEa/FlbD family)